MDVVVLQHIACEPPGEYEAVLHERGARLHRVELDEGASLPALTDFDAIVKSIGAKYDKLTFKYTGPWPPYNFVNIRLKLERA